VHHVPRVSRRPGDLLRHRLRPEAPPLRCQRRPGPAPLRLYRCVRLDASRGWATSSPAEVVSAAIAADSAKTELSRPENDLNVTESNDWAVLRGCNTHVLFQTVWQ
jgi:hypothetical protein